MRHHSAIDSCALQCPCTTRIAVGTNRHVPISPTSRACSLGLGVAPAHAHRAPVTTLGKRRQAPLRTSREIRGLCSLGDWTAEQGGPCSAPSTSRPASAIVTATRPLLDSTAAPQTDAALPPSWPALQPPFTYYASAEEAQTNAVPTGLSPIWKVLLLSDGSVTRHLQLISGSPVSVECLSMRNVGWTLEGLPPGTELIPGPRVQRQVLLRCPEPRPPSGASELTASRRDGIRGGRNGEAPTGVAGQSPPQSSPQSSPLPPQSSSALQPLVFASSWWNADTIDEYLRDKSQPIWLSLSQGHVELYREVHALFRGDSPPLEELLGCRGPFWGRQYIFWSGGRPLTLIYEVFSPRLQQYLGPQQAAEST
ncbi:hypothetical protein PLESTB_001450700 [Pleodorina starrii]|uniref:DUF98 domain-containing protein n=1 Tax=Pleodorina starrii TaxID=330485 RepID=A0A9W6BVR5_9CHLO|nr:hypothetical protein PLESTB_001450700 [Pleodorina starrii]